MQLGIIKEMSFENKFPFCSVLNDRMKHNMTGGSICIQLYWFTPKASIFI